ncbi:MAG TPA: hypothetical protein VIK52_00600 [Opitutaceae bacterium]
MPGTTPRIAQREHEHTGDRSAQNLEPVDPLAGYVEEEKRHRHRHHVHDQRRLGRAGQFQIGDHTTHSTLKGAEGVAIIEIFEAE